MRLAKFIQEIHPGQNPELVASLRRGATSFPVAEQGCASNRDARMFAVDKSPLVDEIVTVRTGSAGMSVDSRWGNVGSPSERLGR
jgi:hypothetical protein